MRNIDSSVWMDNPVLQVVESAKDSPTGGSSFTLFSDAVGVNLEDGGETTVKKAACEMNLLDQLRTLDPRDPGRWPLAVRALFVALIFAVCAGFAWYMLVWNEDRPALQKAEADEHGFAQRSSRTSSNAPPTSMPTKRSSRKWSAASAPCCASCPARPRCRTCWWIFPRRGLAAGLQEKLFQPGQREEQRLLCGAADQDQAGGHAITNSALS